LPPPAARREIGEIVRARRGTPIAWGRGMRSRTLFSDLHQELVPPARPDTYERVRRTLDEALAELQLPTLDKDESARILKLPAATS
jgi:hypothetical protein